ncbi:CaiB/BaiF CoA transferase family protein [Rhodococcus opacus]|uniref:CaiB/BaiF CoA transferase family protein n=1 Tax=Rhodococcus opacus TaxID=37919 RepID=UPI001C43FA59|nr:CaiB/BaiF CoA-transferase family protein [Rhodococcus opacus]MBV6761134.1 CoA transferase [Rhodococcus opacus]
MDNSGVRPRGPLAGLRVVELAGIGPAPFGAMLLADLGAEVLRVQRPRKAKAGPVDPPPLDLIERNRTVWELDLKDPAARADLIAIIERADVVIEGFRPGTMERLGLGPEEMRERNPKLVYGRMTGWGQDGPLAQTAGHDINYIGLTGALDMIGEPGSAPLPPLNYVGDYGGGGMLLAMGLLAAVWEASRSGVGQVVDAAMVDGATVLSTLYFSLSNAGRWRAERGSNMLDGGAPFYRTYQTADGKYMALGALEQPFYEEFAAVAGVESMGEAERLDPANWNALAAKLSALFLTRTRREWTELFQDTNACCTPVLGLSEAAEHEHINARSTILSVAGVAQPAPAPRFSKTPSGTPSSPAQHGDWRELTASWGAPIGSTNRRAPQPATI